MGERCKVPSCLRSARTRGWCNAHYERWRLYGDVQADLPFRSVVGSRFWTHVDVRGEDDCWPWLGYITPTGYGESSYNNKRQRAHRLAWTLAVGPIPESMTIDHLCHNKSQLCYGGYSCQHRRCCNPSHMEVVTMRENLSRRDFTKRKQKEK